MMNICNSTFFVIVCFLSFGLVIPASIQNGYRKHPNETDRTRGMASRYFNQQQSRVTSNQAFDRDKHLHDVCKDESTSSNDSDCESLVNKFCATYDTYQQEINKALISLQNMVIDPDFIAHVQKDGFKMENIVKDLMEHRKDLTERDCAIIFAGETSAGKSTLINLIVGDDILPVDLEQSTTQLVCRIKYCDKLTVSMCNEHKTFESVEEMKSSLEVICKNGNSDIEIVDIGYPVKVLQGNRTCSIVDTPGKGDKRQEKYAQIMEKYLPNALAFVFVIDISHCGGFQDDRVIEIINHTRTSMKTMLCFDPCDTIFVLNKWDALIFQKHKPEEVLFAEKKEDIRKLWKEVKDDYIVKLAAGRIKGERETPFKKEYDTFYGLLNAVVARNENKRTRVHLQFTNEFLEECKRILTWKLDTVETSTKEIVIRLCKLKEDLETLDDERKKAVSDIGSTVDNFVEAATKEFSTFLQQSSFQKDILQPIREQKVTRLALDSALDSLIQKQITDWEKQNIPRIFHKTTIERITRIYTNIYRSLQMIKNDKAALNMSSSLEAKILSLIVSFVKPNDVNFIFGTVLLFQRSAQLNDVISSAVLFAGIVTTALMAFCFLRASESAYVEAFQMKKNVLTENVIKKSFQKKYENLIKDFAQVFLKGELKEEIVNLKQNINDILGNLKLFRNEKDTLQRLKDAFANVEEPLLCLQTSKDEMIYNRDNSNIIP